MSGNQDSQPRHFLFRIVMLWPAALVLTAVWIISSVGIAEQEKTVLNGRVKVVFSGGHETDPVDHGRPVVLIAHALGVTPDVFREAFRHVRPARGGRGPEPAQARANKAALMQVLAPYGISNDRLDAVSNSYRYRPQNGELWPTQSAEAIATLKEGKVVAVKMTRGGFGYSSPPTAHIPGADSTQLQVELSFSPNFSENGAVHRIHIVPDSEHK